MQHRVQAATARRSYLDTRPHAPQYWATTSSLPCPSSPAIVMRAALSTRRFAGPSDRRREPPAAGCQGSSNYPQLGHRKLPTLRIEGGVDMSEIQQDARDTITSLAQWAKPGARVGHARICGSRGWVTARGHPASGCSKWTIRWQQAKQSGTISVQKDRVKVEACANEDKVVHRTIRHPNMHPHGSEDHKCSRNV